MSTEESEQLDLAEFVASLLGEVRSGIHASRGATGEGIEVIAATVRVGQHRVDDADDGDGTRAAGDVDGALGAGSGVGATTGHFADPSSTVEPERGPGAIVVPPRTSPITLSTERARVGWEVELTLGEGEPILEEARDRAEDAASQPPTAISLWAERDLTALKGVDVDRARRFEREGIVTIGQLLEVDEAEIAQVVARQRSNLYLDFWVKAALLRTSAPRLGTSPADHRRLSALAGLAPAQLRQLIGPDVASTSASTLLFDLLAAWGTALDRDAMASVTLRQLRAATRST